jgi:hypothetical protein
VGILWDHLKVVRFERQVRLAERVRHFLAERGLAGPNRTIPLKVGLPLLDNATLEEDDELQDLWARLLVNGGDANSDTVLRRAFVTVLAEMTLLDVRNLAEIEFAINKVHPERARKGVWTVELPKRAIAYDWVKEDKYPGDPSPEVAISLSNLERLGCITTSPQVPEGPGFGLVGLTPFGRAFIRALVALPDYKAAGDRQVSSATPVHQ